MAPSARLFLLATAAAAASSEVPPPIALDDQALEADDACLAGGADCSLNALQRREHRSAAPDMPVSAKSLGLHRLKRSRQRRETTGHIGDGRLEGAAWADYAVNATIGHQTFQVIVDTGSSTFAVAAAPGEGCWEYYTGPCMHHSIAAYYGSGNWTGDVCTGPEVTLAGLSAGSPLFAGIKTQDNFLMDCSKSNNPSGIISEGIVGMAYQELISGFDGVPLFDSVVQATGIPNIFSMQCCGWQGGKAAGGQLVLGGVDSSLYTGEFQYTPITRHAWFCVNLVEAYVDGSELPPPMPAPVCPETFPVVPCFLFPCGVSNAQCSGGLCQCPAGSCFANSQDGLWDCVSMQEPFKPFARLHQLGALQSGESEEAREKLGQAPQDCNAIIDSGTSEIVLGKEDYHTVITQLQTVADEVEGGAQCVRESMLTYFPDVIIHLEGDVKLSVPATTYFQPRPDDSGCYVLFIGRGGAQAIIGQPMMEAYYTVFDKENDRIGFAPIAGCS